MTERIEAENLGALNPRTGETPELVTDLNIVLSKEQIQEIVKGIMQTGQFGQDQVKWSGDYCCVDASIGSSVAGPFSSVGSSVSYNPDSPEMTACVRQKLSADRVKVNLIMPQDISIR